MRKFFIRVLMVGAVFLLISARNADINSKLPENSQNNQTSQGDPIRVWEMDFSNIDGYSADCDYHVEDFGNELVLVSENRTIVEEVEEEKIAYVVVSRILLLSPDGKVLFSEDLSEYKYSVLHGVLDDDGVTISLLSRETDEDGNYSFIEFKITTDENGEYVSDLEAIE